VDQTHARTTSAIDQSRPSDRHEGALPGQGEPEPEPRRGSVSTKTWHRWTGNDRGRHRRCDSQGHKCQTGRRVEPRGLRVSW
jgi:hypothetical protein